MLLEETGFRPATTSREPTSATTCRARPAARPSARSRARPATGRSRSTARSTTTSCGATRRRSPRPGRGPGHLFCFYNERVDLVVDGVALAPPGHAHPRQCARTPLREPRRRARRRERASDRRHVEADLAAPGVGLLREPPGCERAEAPLLGACDGLERHAERAPARVFTSQKTTPPRRDDEVELAVAAAPVAVDDVVAAASYHRATALLAARPDRAAGVGHRHSSLRRAPRC